MNTSTKEGVPSHEQLKSRAHRKKLTIIDENIEKNKKRYTADPKIARPILDKYATKIMWADDIKHIVEGDLMKSIPNDNQTVYVPKHYDISIVLWVAPLNCIRIEFEDTPKNNEKYILQTEIKLKSGGVDYCITGHGGKSDYINIFNIKNIPDGADGIAAKKIFLKQMLTPAAMRSLDYTNLGGTLSPVIGHAHWKAKYDGAVHKMIRGKSPLLHNNNFKKEIFKELRKINKKKENKIKHSQNNDIEWVEDFLLNYCCNEKLPGGQRHQIIEKNLACLIKDREDKDAIIEKYVENKGSPANVRTWFSFIESNSYTLSPGEIANYIRKNNIPYEIQSKKETIKDDEIKPLSGVDKQKAIEILKHPDLVDNIIKGVHQQEGLVGEDDNIKAMLNKIMMRKVIGHTPTSSNLMVSDKSGGGKDALASAVTKFCVPKNELINCTRLSPHVLEYWAESDPEFTWRNKVLYIEDPPPNLVNGDVFRVMLSGGSNVYVLRDQLKVELKIPGKPVFIITSYQSALDYESIRRVDQMRINTSIEQTNKVIDAKSRSAEHKKESRTLFLSRALEMLNNREVVIPFGRYLHFHVKDQLKMRTKISTMIDFIKSSAVLHQYQRETNSNGALIAKPADYEYAAFVFNFLNVGGGAPVNVDEEEVLKILAEEGGSLPLREITMKHKTRGKTWMYKCKDKLKEKGLVREIYFEDEASNKEIVHLELTDEHQKIEFPIEYNQLGFGENLVIREQPPKTRTTCEQSHKEKTGGRPGCPGCSHHLGQKTKSEKSKNEKSKILKTREQPGQPGQPPPLKQPAIRRNTEQLIMKNTRGRPADDREQPKLEKLDPKKYKLMIKDIEKNLTNEPILIIPLNEKMGIKNLNEIQLRQHLMDAAINDPSFETKIRKNEKGYFLVD